MAVPPLAVLWDGTDDEFRAIIDDVKGGDAELSTATVTEPLRTGSAPKARWRRLDRSSAQAGETCGCTSSGHRSLLQFPRIIDRRPRCREPPHELLVP